MFEMPNPEDLLFSFTSTSASRPALGLVKLLKPESSAHGLRSPVGVTTVKEEPRWPGSGDKRPWESAWRLSLALAWPLHQRKQFEEGPQSTQLHRKDERGQGFGLQKEGLSANCLSMVFDENK